MGSVGSDHKPHAVCIPYPAQGHVTPVLKVAKLLHSLHGFHITFVNTEYNHRRLLRSQGPAALDGLPDFRFATIPDGLPFSDEDKTQDVPSLCRSTMTNCLPHFRKLLAELNDPSSGVPKVTCVVSDAVMSFTLDAAKELSIPIVLFWTASAIGYISYRHYRQLMEKGIFPLKDVGQLTDGYLETPIDGVPGATNMRLRDFPSFIRTVDADDIMANFLLREAERTAMASAVLLNTFDDFERPVLEAMAAILPPMYTIGPLPLLARHIPHGPLSSVGSSLWKEESACLKWLENKRPGSVFYVNFEQQTNCRYVSTEWGIGMEIDNDVKRKEVEGLIREIMGGEKGKEMMRRATEWKEIAVKATQEGGPSFVNFNKLVHQVLLPKKDVV
uniref:7-deoxyloganetin glucosyltransferase-like n=1 Tax=Ananas comosus var. bracteatus TaxID=296719 RepID=A0A6V7P8B0_ANACO|nr:unnamed protein product [Ananas comosus var. bracteatus]